MSTDYVHTAYQWLKSNPDHWHTTETLARDLDWPTHLVAGRIARLFYDPKKYPNVEKIDRTGRYRYNTPLVLAPTPEPVQPTLLEPRDTFTDLLKQLAAMNDAMTTNNAVADKLETTASALEDAARQLRHQAITLRGIR